jgi:hypothetical protein
MVTTPLSLPASELLESELLAAGAGVSPLGAGTAGLHAANNMDRINSKAKMN